MTLIDLYKSILDYCSLRPDGNGEVQIVLNDNVLPTKIDNKTLLLPTKTNLKTIDPETAMIFHPFREHFNRGESPVVKKLRHTFNIRANYALLTLMDDLLELIMTPAVHSKFGPRQRELLRAVGDVPAKTRIAFIDEIVTKRLKAAPRAAILNIYLKKAGTFHGKRHPRVGVTTFPIYEFLTNERPSGISADAAKAIMNLVEYVLPGSRDDAESYNSFSDSQDIPWLDCFLNTAYTISSRIHEVTELFKDFIPEKPYRVFNHEWLDEITNLGKYKKEILLIPDQAGNDGSNEPVIQQHQPQPQQRQKPAETVMRDVFQEQEAAQQDTQTQQSAQAGIQGYNMTPLMTPTALQPIVQPQQAQAKSTAITSDGKLDFTKVQTPATMIAGQIQTPLTQAAQQDQLMALYRQMQGNPSAMLNYMANNGYNPNMMPGMMPGMVGMMPNQMGNMVMNQMSPQQILYMQQMQQMNGMAGGMGMNNMGMNTMMPGMMPNGIITC